MQIWLSRFGAEIYTQKQMQNFSNWIFFSSFDQMGEFDIPAMITKVLESTGHTKLFYIGHSMGTTGYEQSYLSMLCRLARNDK